MNSRPLQLMRCVLAVVAVMLANLPAPISHAGDAGTVAATTAGADKAAPGNTSPDKVSASNSVTGNSAPLPATAPIPDAGTTSMPAKSAAALAPFRAEFDLLHDDDVIGQAVMTLKALSGNEWQFETQTEASLYFLSFRDRETSRLRWQDGRPQPLQFDKLRNRPGKTEVITQVFDWQSHTETGKKNDQNWTQALAAGTQDLQSQLLALQADLKAGKTPITYTVSRYGKVREYRYAITAEEVLNTKLGNQKTLRVERIREPNDDRQTISWFAPALGHVPVRVQQYEDGALQADLQIRKLTR